MAESTPNKSRKIWRSVLTGAAAVPIAVFAAAPAVGAVGVHETETVHTEQLPVDPGLPDPGLPVDPPVDLDPAALLDLQACLAELEELVGETPEVPAPELPAAEQLPVDPGLPVDPPAELPDVGALAETCQTVLDALKDTAPEVPDPELPATEPADAR